MENNNPWKVESMDFFLCWKCPECSFDTQGEDDFQEHAVENHPLSHVFFGTVKIKEEESLTIKECYYQNPANIESVHEKQKPFSCPNCDSIFTSNSKLKRHIMTVHEGIKPFKCEFCPLECGSNSDLKRHVARVHEKNKPFQCELCPLTYGTKSDLHRHLSGVHEKNNLYPFEENDPLASTENSQENTKNMIDCEIEIKNEFTNTEMDSIFKEEISETELLQNDNDKLILDKSDKISKKQKPLECSICNINFGIQRKKFRKHIAEVHDGIKPKPKCSICNNTFLTQVV